MKKITIVIFTGVQLFKQITLIVRLCGMKVMKVINGCVWNQGYNRLILKKL